MYETGDAAIRDADGRVQIAGRMDDIINIAGHRISTAEIEDCVSAHPMTSESAVISIPHDIKGWYDKTFNAIFFPREINVIFEFRNKIFKNSSLLMVMI